MNNLFWCPKKLDHYTATTAIYARFGQDNVKDALNRHGEQILAGSGIKPTAEIISIDKAKKAVR